MVLGDAQGAPAKHRLGPSLPARAVARYPAHDGFHLILPNQVRVTLLGQDPTLPMAVIIPPGETNPALFASASASGGPWPGSRPVPTAVATAHAGSASAADPNAEGFGRRTGGRDLSRNHRRHLRHTRGQRERLENYLRSQPNHSPRMRGV